MSIETFVTIHDSDLVQACEDSGQFSSVSHTYLFVGPREVRVPAGVKVIACREYLPNYEQYPHFYDFTGWYVLARHGLITTNNAIFLQYDHVNISENINVVVEEALQDVPVVSFVPAPSHFWTLGIPNFYQKQVEGIAACGLDWERLVSEQPFSVWPSTQGTAWRTADFNKFMMWFEPAFDVFKTELYAGHLAERMIQPYLMANGQGFIALEGLVQHQSLDCHGTMDVGMGNMQGFYQKSLTFGR